MKTHRIINLVNNATNISYSFSIGTITYVEGDYQNGIRCDLEDATILYDFALNHVGETFYINDLKGITLTINESSENLYKNTELTEKWKTFNCKIRILGTGTGYSNIDFSILPYYNGSEKIYSNSSFDTGNQKTNFFGMCFCWDLNANNLTVTGLSYRVTYLSGLSCYEIVPMKSVPDIDGVRLPGGIKTINEEFAKRVTPAWFGWNNKWWSYIFTNYNKTTNADKDDVNKQKPIEWKYPNGPGGPSKPGGGDGDQDDTSDPIPVDDIIDGLSSDFVKLYKITKSNLTALAEYMLQDSFLTNIKKLYADPMDAIISLNSFPINASGTSEVITTSGVSTGINGIKINNTIVDIDCGTISMKEYWGSFLDYEIKISLFLPYVGIQAISTDDFMNDIIHVIYRVDLLSGGFVVFVKNSKGIVHQTTGNMAYHMPVTSIDYSRMYSSLISGVVGIAGNAAAGNTAGVISGTLSTIQNFHPQIQMNGNFGGNTGICSNKKPYLIIERPVPNVPENYSEIKGNTSNVSVMLGNCSGFTQISDMQIKHISATDAEKEKILNPLSSGVYF